MSLSQQSMHQAYRNRYPWKMADRECVMCSTKFVVWVKERKMTCCELLQTGHGYAHQRVRSGEPSINTHQTSYKKDVLDTNACMQFLNGERNI